MLIPRCPSARPSRCGAAERSAPLDSNRELTFRGVAQPVACLNGVQEVPGSNPAPDSIIYSHAYSARVDARWTLARPGASCSAALHFLPRASGIGAFYLDWDVSAAVVGAISQRRWDHHWVLQMIALGDRSWRLMTRPLWRSRSRTRSRMAHRSVGRCRRRSDQRLCAADARMCGPHRACRGSRGSIRMGAGDARGRDRRALG